MPQVSAGILLYRPATTGPEVLLVHPGGPFWAARDDGAWSIPKGLVEPGEDAEAAALREFGEETGASVTGPLAPLGRFRQQGGKLVIAFALEGDLDVATLVSNSFEMEWPPRSGHLEAFPEVDRAAWFTPEQARRKMRPGQAPIIAALLDRLGLVPVADMTLPRSGR